MKGEIYRILSILPALTAKGDTTSESESGLIGVAVGDHRGRGGRNGAGFIAVRSDVRIPTAVIRRRNASRLINSNKPTASAIGHCAGGLREGLSGHEASEQSEQHSRHHSSVPKNKRRLRNESSRKNQCRHGSSQIERSMKFFDF
jgi:hypothetical protein